jgi:hypothetical protein
MIERLIATALMHASGGSLTRQAFIQLRGMHKAGHGCNQLLQHNPHAVCRTGVFTQQRQQYTYAGEAGRQERRAAAAPAASLLHCNESWATACRQCRQRVALR